MSCTCLLRTSNRALSSTSTSASSRLVLKAGFSSQSLLQAPASGQGAKPAAAAATASPSSATPTRAAAAGLASATGSLSSCPAGTVLPGLNFSKTGSDPIAKANNNNNKTRPKSFPKCSLESEDSEYPSWLWTLLSPRKAPASISASPREVALFDQKRKMKSSSKTAIRARNTLTD